jgi:hypothetical protein
MFSLVIFPCLVSILLLLWFNSTAFVEYSKLFGISKFFFVDIFEEILLNSIDDSFTYQSFLQEHYNCFFIRLITCPKCLSVWLSFFVSLLHAGVWYCEGAPLIIILLSSPAIISYNSLVGLILYFSILRLIPDE